MPLRRFAAALVLAATALTVLTFAVRGRAEQPRQPVAAAATVAAPSSADLEFAQMMVAHHAQAVRMSRALVAKPGIPERVRLIADFIAHDQQREIDETNAWLTAWGAADAAGGHHHAGGGSAGMLTEAQLRALDAATGPAAGRMFLRLMIEHHTGAITMARSLLDGDGRNVYTHGMAKHVINEQTAENDAMRALL
ncbi:DUF305 domain-containing protein [Couchioplanes caeruleus]|uniref:DUF305 domain-containing protein n=1 Tax=Couchioplanes caeruleus TaxID=56438 RepID=UPI0020BE2E81|nr:DUF305 domain-containing protein [Couchioplanes caeruleus]UQU62231.1 DUF305 domain-containing protein [Couchioplanes caeruleus]